MPRFFFDNINTKQRYMDISVVIPSYNQPETIKKCVNSVLAQEFSGTLEVIIVDSSPKDKQDVIAEFCNEQESLRLIRLDKQTFPGTARNVGIKQAQGTNIALIDSDCLALEGWLQHIYDNMKPNTILTGAIVNGTEGNRNGTCSYLVEFNHFMPFEGEPRPIHGAATCNFACEKEVFDRVGYFTDDRAFEDMLFCHRFLEEGGQIMQYPQIKIAHLNKTDLQAVVRNLTMLGEFSAIVRKKHGLPPKLVFSFPVLSPLLAVFRYASIFSRIIKSGYKWDFFRYTPWVVYLLAQWSKGFYKGATKSSWIQV